MRVLITSKARKEFAKILRGDRKSGLQIQLFLREILPNASKPKSLANAKKLEGFSARYRWRIGGYRIIGTVRDEILQIEIIKIASREDAYK